MYLNSYLFLIRMGIIEIHRMLCPACLLLLTTDCYLRFNAITLPIFYCTHFYMFQYNSLKHEEYNNLLTISYCTTIRVMNTFLVRLDKLFLFLFDCIDPDFEHCIPNICIIFDYFEHFWKYLKSFLSSIGNDYSNKRVIWPHYIIQSLSLSPFNLPRGQTDNHIHDGQNYGKLHF